MVADEKGWQRFARYDVVTNPPHLVLISAPFRITPQTQARQDRVKAGGGGEGEWVGAFLMPIHENVQGSNVNMCRAVIVA